MQVQLPDGSIALNAESSAPKPAFLIRLPEDAWASLEAAAASSSDGFGAGGTVQISPDGSIVCDFLYPRSLHILSTDSYAIADTSPHSHYTSPTPNHSFSKLAQ